MKQRQNKETGDIWAFNDSDDVDALIRAGKIRDVFLSSIVQRPSKFHTWDTENLCWIEPSVVTPKLTMMQRIKNLIGIA